MKKIVILCSVVGLLIVAGNAHGAESEAGRSVTLGKQLNDAVERGTLEEVRTLLAQGADVNATSKDGETALMFAAKNGHKEIVELLIKQGADVNAVSLYGETALMFATIKGHKEIVELLIKQGADVNAIRPDGLTALIWAAEKGYKDIVELLLRNGADSDEDEYECISDREINELLEHAMSLDELIASTEFYTEQKPELLYIINNNKNNDPLFQLFIQRTQSVLKKHKTNTNSNEYRNAARILYTLARRIAQDYIKALGTKSFQTSKVLPHELEAPIFVASYHPALVGLHVTNSGGQDESFVDIVEENIDRLMPK